MYLELYVEHHQWCHWGLKNQHFHLVSNRSTKPVLIASNVNHVPIEELSDQSCYLWVSFEDLWWPFFVAINQVLKLFKLSPLISNFLNYYKVLEIMKPAFLFVCLFLAHIQWLAQVTYYLNVSLKCGVISLLPVVTLSPCPSLYEFRSAISF